MVLVGSVAIYQQWEIMGQNSTISNLQQQSNMGACGVNNQTGAPDFSPESSQVIAPSGLELSLTVSNGSIRCGDTIYANASLFNTLDTNLTVAVDTAALPSNGKWGYYVGYPCGSDLLVQLAVFAGYYDQSNFSRAGDPLFLHDASVAILCITTTTPSPTALVFLPSSGTAYKVSGFPSVNGTEATVSAVLQHWGCSPENGQGGKVCNYETGASGYYSGGGGPQNNFRLFQYGVYTIAALDDWGDVALVHFVVQ